MLTASYDLDGLQNERVRISPTSALFGSEVEGIDDVDLPITELVDVV